MKLNKNLFVSYFGFFLIFTFSVFLNGCKTYTEEEKKYISEIEKKREVKNQFMRDDPASPFNARTKVEFKPLKYFDVNPNFVFQSTLTENEVKDTVVIFGTKGEERNVVRFGFLQFVFENKTYKLNVYEATAKTGEKHHSIWFTDKTTAEETYGVGRYLNFELNPEKNFVYTIDFNLAFNPYCAYSKDYSCAIPTREDYIDLKIRAGEKTFHN